MPLKLRRKKKHSKKKKSIISSSQEMIAINQHNVKWKQRYCWGERNQTKLFNKSSMAPFLNWCSHSPHQLFMGFSLETKKKKTLYFCGKISVLLFSRGFFKGVTSFRTPEQYLLLRTMKLILWISGSNYIICLLNAFDMLDIFLDFAPE